MASYDSDHELGDSYYHATTQPSSSSRITRLSRPLIDSVRNGWQSSSAYRSLSSSPENNKHPGCVEIALSIIAAPRFRRYVLVYLVLFLLGWAGWAMILYPRLEERSALLHALDPASKAEVGGWFGSNSLPRFDGLTHIRTLDPSLVPVARIEGESRGSRSEKRLVVVGDVHGCKEELEQLLKKIEFSVTDGDHLILTGDIINKGPDSGGVVDLARELGASCVRGNHEDRILLLRHEMITMNTLLAGDEKNVKLHEPSEKEAKERALARSLSEEQARWLEACPVILNVGSVQGIGQVVVVHAGLVPGVELEKQDPSTVMTMRTMDLDTHVPSEKTEGMSWAKMFDKHQSILHSSFKSSHADPRSQTTTVIYGHDAKTGLKIRTYTKGLDSGCVKGGKLTALVIEDGGKQSLVQVSCKQDYSNESKDKETKKEKRNKKDKKAAKARKDD
ncbi:Ser/Thr protein phosphatase family [Penicillium brasilianum]|uniref:Ser/Thr protein phosphatase family n=1 Tax=Penicillium brasilianum TaxID=104259 RepID=A0A1S9RJL6_PENBI|nr:Ser/Thr protein phosphatase family [Penicillium brasilianum]